MFIATLVGIFKYDELPEKYGPFVQYKASIEDKTIKEDEKIAILNVTGTESYHVLFLKSYSKIAEIEKELNEADAKLNYSSKKILEEHL
ncbi:MAG: hypothetical protein A4E26_02155 [Methanobacterium sp. PtaU1.Bin097]|jgi:hypothetical protein|nr:MAG: hypothetical protein A4E26_02155 [Methanobacterium sp. PtaU1.Bin097]